MTKTVALLEAVPAVGPRGMIVTIDADKADELIAAKSARELTENESGPLSQ